MNNNYCYKCGQKLEGNSQFCSNCGAQLTASTSTNIEQNNTTQNNTTQNIETTNTNITDNGNLLGILSLLLYFAGSFVIGIITYILPESIRDLFSVFAGFCPVAGIVLMIVGRVKFPENKLLKVAMWIIIASIIAGILFFIFIIVMCYITCSNVDTSGCN